MLVLLLIQQMGQPLHSGIAVSQLGLLVLDQLVCCNDLLGHEFLVHLQGPAPCPVSYSTLQSGSASPAHKLQQSASVWHTAPQAVPVCVMSNAVPCCGRMARPGDRLQA